MVRSPLSLRSEEIRQKISMMSFLVTTSRTFQNIASTRRKSFCAFKRRQNRRARVHAQVIDVRTHVSYPLQATTDVKRKHPIYRFGPRRPSWCVAFQEWTCGWESGHERTAYCTTVRIFRDGAQTPNADQFERLCGGHRTVVYPRKAVVHRLRR